MGVWVREEESSGMWGEEVAEYTIHCVSGQQGVMS